MSDIVITEFMDEGAVRDLERDYDVLYSADLWQRPQDMIAAVAQARALIVRNRTQVTAALLAAAPRLKVVGRLGVGLDNIDLEAARARGVAVLPASGGNTVSVAEYVIAAALVLLRGAFFANARMLAGEWPREELMGREAQGRTMGIVGFGVIGRAVAERARALGMRVIACDAFLGDEDPAWREIDGGRRSFDAVLEEADVLSLHVPLSEATRRLIDAQAIARMRKGAVLINTARGGVVDEEALVAALRSGHLGGAALDVFETEPLTRAAAARFAQVPNLILTPHIAGPTQDSNLRVSAITADNVRRVLESAA